MRRLCIIIIFSLFYSAAFAQEANDTFKLYFDLDIPALNETAQHKIDTLIYNDRIVTGSTVTIVGYADYLGDESHNKPLSEHRAQNVKEYLVTNGIKRNNIKVCIGKGEISRAEKPGHVGYPTDRRVDIVVKSTRTASVTPKFKYPKPKTKIGTKVAIQPTKTYKNDLIDLDKYKTGQTFVLKNIYFLPESHKIRDESLPILGKLYDIMKENPTLKIRIEGHVCCVRDFPDAFDKDNGQLNLSENRAKAVYDFLVEKEIGKDRLKYTGYGRSKPIVLNEITEEDANKNRRVEIRILEK